MYSDDEAIADEAWRELKEDLGIEKPRVYQHGANLKALMARVRSVLPSPTSSTKPTLLKTREPLKW